MCPLLFMNMQPEAVAAVVDVTVSALADGSQAAITPEIVKP